MTATFQHFKTISGKMGVPQVGIRKSRMYQVSPNSSFAKAWHAREEPTGSLKPILSEANSSTNSCNINLLNIQGLVTNRKNKSKMLKIKCDKESNNLITIFSKRGGIDKVSRSKKKRISIFEISKIDT